MLIDLHTHTFPKSFDSFISIDDLIDIAKQRRLDGVCLSDHDAVWSPDEAIELARRHDFLVLPAIEVTTERGHMLSFGLTSYTKAMYTFTTLAEEVERESGVMVAAHPFRGHVPWGVPTEAEFDAALQKVLQNPAFAHCVALETMNGRSGHVENDYAVKVCNLLKMAATAGTDTHQISDVGRCATEFERRIESVQDLIEELRAGRFRPADLNMPKPAAQGTGVPAEA